MADASHLRFASFFGGSIGNRDSASSADLVHVDASEALRETPQRHTHRETNDPNQPTADNQQQQPASNRILLGPQDTAAIVGQPTDLSCLVERSQAPALVWFRNKMALSHGESIIPPYNKRFSLPAMSATTDQQQPINYTLHISRVSLADDETIFDCLAGADQRKAKLNVWQPPTWVSVVAKIEDQDSAGGQPAEPPLLASVVPDKQVSLASLSFAEQNPLDARNRPLTYYLSPITTHRRLLRIATTTNGNEYRRRWHICAQPLTWLTIYHLCARPHTHGKHNAIDSSVHWNGTHLICARNFICSLAAAAVAVAASATTITPLDDDDDDDDNNNNVWPTTKAAGVGRTNHAHPSETKHSPQARVSR